MKHPSQMSFHWKIVLYETYQDSLSSKKLKGTFVTFVKLLFLHGNNYTGRFITRTCQQTPPVSAEKTTVTGSLSQGS